jgi:uncharacterized protein YecT (DUF1311 family)
MLSKHVLIHVAGCFSIGFLSLSPAIAQPNNLLNCKNPQTQVEMNACAAQRAQVSDRRLNEVYRQVRAKYSENPRSETQLIEAQRAWIRFRDRECTFSRSRYEGGSIAPLVYSSCIDRLTQQRTTELENYLKDGNI